MKLKAFYKQLVLFLLSFLFVSCSKVSIQDNNGVVITCDTIIDKEYYEICYDYEMKGALFVSYSLDSNKVNNPNIEEKPSFYKEPSLDKNYQSEYDDYTGSGYDRGHLASDASFDWSIASLDSVYSMANIIPQHPEVNRYQWIDTEYLERKKAVEYESVNVIIGIVYSDNPLQIGENFISVPSGFYKSILSEDGKYQECFYYENTPEGDLENDSIINHQVDCSTLTLQYEIY